MSHRWSAKWVCTMGPNFLAQLATITKKSLEIQIEEKEIVDVVITFSFFYENNVQDL